MKNDPKNQYDLTDAGQACVTIFAEVQEAMRTLASAFEGVADSINPHRVVIREAEAEGISKALSEGAL